MNLIQYPLFPTLILRFLKFVDSKECKKIFKLLKTKKCSDHLSLIKGKSSHKENYDVLSFTSLDLTNALKEYSRQSHFELENKITHSWFNIQEKNSVLKEHCHADSRISGVIFIKVDSKSSKLYFHNPNPHISYTKRQDTLNEYSYDWFYIKPSLGDLVLFPSWIQHGSNHTQNLSDKRAVISFNAL